MLSLKLKFYPRLESIFSALEQATGAAREYFAICKDCGANRYTGEPCVTYPIVDGKIIKKTTRRFIAGE
jgi:hypothetical protein